MTEAELLWFVLVDTFTSNLVFIVNPELAIWAAPILSNVSHEKIYIVGGLGAFFASIVNFILGISCSKIFNIVLYNNKKAQHNEGILRNIYNNFGIYLILLSFMPVYSKFIVLFAGFARYKPIRTILLVFIIKTISYAYFK